MPKVLSVPHVPLPGRIDGRQQRWDRHNAERRLQILTAAVELIEELPIGSDVHVQQIAERAGVVRTVVYRHFNGRDDLNRSVQQHVAGLIRSTVEPTLVWAGSANDMIERIIGSYVQWVAAHPNLHHMLERQLGDGQPGELDRAVAATLDQFSALIRRGAEILGLDLSKAQGDSLDLLVVGLIGQVRGTVNLWVRRPVPSPKPAVLTKMLSQWTWYQIDGQARELGVVLDPDLPVERLMAPPKRAAKKKA
jgi:AcrR family transcriptional regulator